MSLVAIENMDTFWIRGDKAKADRAALAVSMYAAGEAMRECARAGDCHTRTVTAWAERAGVKRSVSAANVAIMQRGGRGPEWDARLTRLYVDHGLTSSEAAEVMGETTRAVLVALSRLGVRRTRAEAAKMRKDGRTRRGREKAARVVTVCRAFVGARFDGKADAEGIAAEAGGVQRKTVYRYLHHPANPYGEDVWRSEDHKAQDPALVREVCAAVVATRSGPASTRKSIQDVADDFGLLKATVYHYLQSRHNPYPKSVWREEMPAAFQRPISVTP